MKILILQDDFPPHHAGGAGIIAYNLAKGFAHAGHDVLVVTTVKESRHAGVAEMDGFKIIRLHSNYHERWRAYRSIWNFRLVSGLKRVLKEFAPDVVHVHNVHLHLSYYSLVLARRYAKRVYLTAHDTDTFNTGKFISNARQYSFWALLRTYRWRYNPFRTLIIRTILARNVDMIIAVSHALMNALNEHRITTAAVIHNGIDVHEWHRPGITDSFREMHALGDSVILFGGRLSGLKGAEHAIKALGIISSTITDAQLLIIGKKDAYGERMLKLAEEMGIADRVIFTGWIAGDQLRAAYYAASVAIVPSLYLDPFPTINLEAFACKKPVVATCFGGSPEIVRDDVCGYIVDPFDIPLMASKISDILSDADKRTRFGEAGYEHVVAEFSLTAQIDAYESIFKKQ